MTKKGQLLVLTLMALVLGANDQVVAQRRKAAGNFQGRWSWAVYAKDKNELPPGYQDMKLEEVPRYSFDLNIKQKGTRLTAEVGATSRYLAKIEDADFDTIAKGDVAQVRLESGFGGKVIARITLSADKLYWKVIRAEGEHYFPTQVVLHRIQKRS